MDEKAVEVARPLGPLVVGTTLAIVLKPRAAASLDDSDCRAAAQTKASGHVIRGYGGSGQAYCHEARGRNIALVKLQAVDTIVSYDGQCEGSKTNKVERGVQMQLQGLVPPTLVVYSRTMTRWRTNVASHFARTWKNRQ